MLQITDLTYRIAGRILLDGISLTLPDGHHAGLIGRNGTGKSTLLKIIAGYHQLHAVNAAVEETVRASGMGKSERTLGGKPGDRRAGVVWHTQGSGKSFSMLFYAARIVRHPAMQNPTLVLLTDRNDLDDQLFGQFLRCHELLRQMPVQASGTR